MVPLAFLNLGPSEVALILLLLLVFFGVDRLPQLARSLGRFRGEMERATQQFSRAIEDEESRVLRGQLDFERQREHQMKAQQMSMGESATDLRAAAKALGINPEGMSDDEVRAAVAARVEATKPSLGEDAAQKT